MKRKPSQPAHSLAFLLLLCVACVKQDAVEIHWQSADFNDRLRTDLHALAPADLTADLERGFFRDGTDGGLVSPLFPLAASRPSGVGHLVQTACLFVGEERDTAGARVAADELRMAWEVVADIDRSHAPFDELFVEGREALGLCTFSNPVSRLLFEDPERPIRAPEARLCGWGDNDGAGFAGALTLDSNDWPSNRNLPIDCAVPLGHYAVAVDAYIAAVQDRDGRCPSAAPVSPPVRLDGRLATAGPALRGDHFSACALPAIGVVPTSDTTYRLSLHTDAGFDGSLAERSLRPDILTVPGRREIVRPLTALASGRYSWSTKVDPEAGEGPVRWGENFTPTVRVESVEIVSREAGSGAGERVERPASDRLVVTIPQAGGADAIVTCAGRLRAGKFSFEIDPASGSSDCAFDGPSLRAMTPTYAVAVLDLDPPVTRPIRWEASVPGLGPERELFIRFRLVGRSRPAALKAKALHSFGRVQVGQPAQAALTLENVGGRALEVQSVVVDAASHHPLDFAFFVTGEPVAVPLPIALEPLPGGEQLRWSAAAREQDLLRSSGESGSIVVSWGDVRRGAATEPVDLYGEAGGLVGGWLLRAEREARFEIDTPGEVLPFATAAGARLEPPFLLAPGARAFLAVTARPLSTGQRSARIAIKAIDPSRPTSPLTAVATVSVEGIVGPELRWLPASMWIKWEERDAWHEPSRWMLVENAGASPLTVSSLSLDGPGAARFELVGEAGAPPFVLAPGASTRLQVIYRPTCDGDYSLPEDEADVYLVSNGGSGRLPVHGLSAGYCELP